jgi:hypothetical protein
MRIALRKMIESTEQDSQMILLISALSFVFVYLASTTLPPLPIIATSEAHQQLRTALISSSTVKLAGDKVFGSKKASDYVGGVDIINKKKEQLKRELKKSSRWS